MHPTYLGIQIDWPLFVKMPLQADSKTWKVGEHFNWLERGISADKVASLYITNFVYHNEQLEVQNKLGDRLSEMDSSQLVTLVSLLNAEVKNRSSSTTEFTQKRCKKSLIDTKHRGLIRRFLNNNAWISEDFYRIRDTILVD